MTEGQAGGNVERSGRCCSFHMNLKYSLDGCVCVFYVAVVYQSALNRNPPQGFPSYYKSDQDTVEMVSIPFAVCLLRTIWGV